jgi:hypothetical protein
MKHYAMALTSPTSSSRLVTIVCSLTEATGFSLVQFLCQEDIWGHDGIFPQFFTMMLALASHPSCFVPGEMTSGTHWISSQEGPRASLDTVEK